MTGYFNIEINKHEKLALLSVCKELMEKELESYNNTPENLKHEHVYIQLMILRNMINRVFALAKKEDKL